MVRKNGHIGFLIRAFVAEQLNRRSSCQPRQKLFVLFVKGLFGVAFFRHRHLEKDGELRLDAGLTSVVCQVETSGDLDGERGGEDRVFAKKIDLKLHWLS